MSNTSDATPTTPAPAPNNKTKRRIIVAILLTVSAVVVIVVGWILFGNSGHNSPPLQPISGTLSFSGPSEQLHDTVIVPTQETTLTAGKSAIWCGALRLAWHRFEKDIVHGRLILKGAEELSRSLSDAPVPELEEGDYYTAAGLGRDGIFDRIKTDMAKFPGAAVPEAPSDPRDYAIAYAYLQATVSYKFAFNDNSGPLRFKDSKGKETEVQAFGITDEDNALGSDTYRSQVLVLFRKGSEFAVDLSYESSPYQIVLARIARKATLKATLDELQRRTLAGGKKRLNDAAVLLVPNMHWKVGHRFRDLEDKVIVSPSAPENAFMYRAIQVTEFKLDRKGARVAASGLLGQDLLNGDPPDPYVFNGPFLIVLRKRGSNNPFFVIWVDNAELLQPFAHAAEGRSK